MGLAGSQPTDILGSAVHRGQSAGQRYRPRLHRHDGSQWSATSTSPFPSYSTVYHLLDRHGELLKYTPRSQTLASCSVLGQELVREQMSG